MPVQVFRFSDWRPTDGRGDSGAVASVAIAGLGCSPTESDHSMVVWSRRARPSWDAGISPGTADRRGRQVRREQAAPPGAPLRS